MSRPWMPLYVGDFLRDTRHLTTIQVGAYMLLIMEYWTKGCLPSDVRVLQRICGLTGRDWHRNWQALAAMFGPEWTHKRIDAELKKQEIISIKRQMAGMRGGLTSRGRTNRDRNVTQAFAKQTGEQSQPHKISYLHGEKGKEESSSRRSGFETLSEIVKSKGWSNE